MTSSSKTSRKHSFLSKAIENIKILFSESSNTKSEIDSLKVSFNELRDLLIQDYTRLAQEAHPNPLNSFGRKGFSQSDEDGITIEILKRLKLPCGSYAEFGVGNGMENNTLILAAMGWRGFWVGGEDLAFSSQDSNRFCFLKSWITLDNILDLAAIGMNKTNIDSIDLISLDLDGNDIYFTEALLNKFKPKVFIVEYNAQFPPPARFQIDYSQTHKWMRDNYFGAALQNFYDLFISHGYKLVCCNSHTGANAFFIRGDYAHLFPDVPNDISKIFVSPRYTLYQRYGHPQSQKVVESLLRGQ